MAAGSWLGLPELGISEMFGGNKTSLYNPRQIIDAQRNRDALGISKNPSAPSYKSNTPTTYSTGYSSAPTAQRTVDTLQTQRNNQESNLRSSISNRANSYKSNLGNLEKMLPQYQAEDTAFINQGFDTSLNNLSLAKQAGMDKLGANRAKVDTYKTGAISDLQSDLRNQMMATQMQLGAMGAGDSSASQVMAPYAFAKAGSQARSGILNNANNQYADIDAQQADIGLAYDTEKSNIERDKIGALSNIQAEYRNKLMQVREAKNFADDRQYEALNNLEMSLLDEVSGKLSQVQSFVLERNAELEDWARSRWDSINNTASAFSNPNDNTQAIDAGNLPGLTGQSVNGVDYSYNPLVLMRNKRQELFA